MRRKNALKSPLVTPIHLNLHTVATLLGTPVQSNAIQYNYFAVMFIFMMPMVPIILFCHFSYTVCISSEVIRNISQYNLFIHIQTTVTYKFPTVSTKTEHYTLC